MDGRTEARIDVDPARPKVIVINVPGFPPPTGAMAVHATCDKCGARHRVALSTSLTIAQLTQGETRPPVLCYACLVAIRGGVRPGDTLAGMRDGRRHFGLADE